MSREAGELHRTASPNPLGPSDGYSKSPPTVSSTAISPELVPEDSFPAALADNSLIAARHRHHEAKENITAALHPAYSHEKVYHAMHSTGSFFTPDCGERLLAHFLWRRVWAGIDHGVLHECCATPIPACNVARARKQCLNTID